MEISIGIVISAALLGYTLARLPGWEWMATVTALLPAVGGWLLMRARRSAESEAEAQRLLLETHDTAEQQFDDFQQANAELQSTNITLNQQLSELTTLNEIGQALSVTLDLQELLDKSLQAVTAHLAFDRGLILLLEERAGSSFLCRGRIIGGTPEMAALMAQTAIQIGRADSFLTEVIRSGKPKLVRNVSTDVIDSDTRTYLAALGASEFLAVPLITQGKPVGLLAVDNAVTGRPISSAGQDLLVTIGAQIASVIDSARLYQTLEQRVVERTADLARAMQQAEEARAAAEQANRERGALLDEMVRQNQYLAALHDTTVGLISRLDVNELLEALVTRAGLLLDAPHGFIFLAEPGEEELECKVGVGILSQSIGSRRKRGEGLAGTVWQTGQALVIDDYTHWPGRLNQIEPGALGAIMGVPLKSGGQVVGAIGLAYAEGTDRRFGKEETEFLSRFAQLGSVALDNARLYSTAQDTQRRLAYIIDFWPDAAFILDSKGRVSAWNRAIEEMTGVSAQEMLGQGDYAYAVPFYGERRPVLIDLVNLSDEEIEHRYLQIMRQGGVLTGEAYVPQLKGKGAYLYAMAAALYDSQGHPAGAIEIIRDVTARREAEEAVKRNEAHFRLLVNIGQALSSTLDMPSLYRLIYEQVSGVMHAEDMLIALHDEVAREVEFVYSHQPDEVAVGTRDPVDSGLTGYIAKSGEPLLLRCNIFEEIHRLGLNPLGRIPAAWLGVPMLIGDRVLGVIAVQHYTDPAAYDETHRDLLEAVASQAAIAIENARLFAAEQRLVEQFRLISEVDRRITALLRTDVLLWEIARLIKDTLRYYLVGIALIEGDELAFKAGSGGVWEMPGFQPPRIRVGQEGITGWVAENGEPLLVPDVTKDPRYYSLPEASEMRSELAVPLRTKERVIGVLHVQSDHVNAFDESDLTVLQSLAQQAAIAIENSRLYDQAQLEKQHFESVVLNSPTAIVVSDLQTRVRSWNPAAEKLFGYTQQEAIGRPMDDLVAYTEAMRAQAIAYTEQALRGEMIHEITQRCRKDGSLVDVEMLAVPLVLQGVQTGSLAIYHDITELQQAREAAEEATRAKSEFLARMSHEIRTPMNAIIGLSQLALQTELTVKQEDYVSKILASARNLLGIINDILDFSKIEAGRLLELETVNFSLDDVLENIANQVAMRAAEKGLEFLFSIVPDVPLALVGDPLRLGQVLLNLASNAIKFTAAGESVITVELASKNPEQALLRFGVRDTGIGMTPEQIAGLFQPFAQADKFDHAQVRRYGSGVGHL